MAYALETSYREALLAAVFGGQALPTIPASWELGLYNGNPLDGGTEISGGNYARQTVASSFWSAGTGTPLTAPGAVGNTIELRWPATGTAGAVWDFTTGNALWLSLHDAGGTVRVSQQFLDRDILGRTVPTDQYLLCDPGQIVFYWVNAPATMEVALSLTFRTLLLRWLLAGDALTIPATWEWSLWVGSPFAGGGEVYDPEYARISRVNDNTEWSAAGATAESLQALRWPASGSPVRLWGLCTHIALGPVGAAPYVAIKLSAPVAVGPNVPLDLAAGKIVLTTIF